MGKPLSILVDGSNLFYRLAWAFRDFKTSSGKSSGVQYGFLKQLRWLKSSFYPKQISIFWDCPLTDTQKKDGYKANREASEFKSFVYQQVEECFELIKVCGVNQFKHSALEADYLIAQFVKDYNNYTHYIMSTDDDLKQLVSDGSAHIIISDKQAGRFLLMKEMEVLAKFGTLPKKLAILKAIIGDKSDNLPGAERISRAPLCQLINREEVTDVESFYRHISRRYFSKLQYKKLIDHKSQAVKNYCYINLYQNWDICWQEIGNYGEWNESQLREIMLHYEINSMLHLPLKEVFYSY